MCAPRVLLSLSGVLLVLGAAGVTGAPCAADDYCCQLEEIALDVLREATTNCTPQHFNTQDTVLSVEGAPARVELAHAAGAAATAATEVLRALLRRVLRLAADSVRLAPDPVHAFCADRAQPDPPPRTVLTVSIASAWRAEQCGSRPASVMPGAPPGSLPPALAGRRRALPLGPGAASLARRLFARDPSAAAPSAAAACAADWRALAAPSCGFLNTTRVLGDAAPSEWSKCTCPEEGAECVTVLVVQEGEGRERALLEELCSRAAAAAAAVPPLRPAALPRDAALRAALAAPGPAFLFLDYDLWADAAPDAGVHAAPPLPCAGNACDGGDSSLLVADAGLLMQYAPRVLSLVYRFRPARALVRAALALPGPPERAACRAAVQHRSALVDWFRFCEPKRALLVVPCLDHDFDYTYHKKIIEAVELYWTLDKQGMSFDITFSNLTKKIKPCNDATQANTILKEYTNYWMWTWTAGMVVQSAAGAEALARTARDHRVPLVLAQAPPRQAAGPGAAPRAAAAPAPALARALRSVLRRCGWRRVALLREGTRTQVWEELLSMESLVTHEQELDARRPEAALAALRAVGARVVVLAAGAESARGVLAAAAAATARATAPVVWLVLGAAGADWRPPPGFAYVTLSSAWRGGGEAPGGSARLRERLDAALDGRWAPLTAPLVDALLLLMTSIERSLHKEPRFHNDPHSPEFNKLVFQELDNATVKGVTHTFRQEPPFIFVHHWSANGSRLLGTWPGGEGEAGVGGGGGGALCGAGRVRDAAVCRTASLGRDAFVPHCLDGPIAIAACALVLAPPALWAAAAARRARLRRRDRAVELRLLARSAPSADAAAAGAALAGHAVPRTAVELLDRLGRGSSGDVWLAMLRLPGRPPLAVAAKAPRADGGAEADAALLHEAALLSALRHEHVVRLVGACLGPSPLALMENAFHGDLQGYLRARRPAAERARAGEPEPEAAHVSALELTRLAREAAAALGYLAHARLVHRDVRAANCLVDARHSLKLADFGMARRTDEGGAGAAAGEYLCRRRGLFPVLWMAPESLAGGVFTAASDVWALGVLLLELVTLGARPYGAWSPVRVLRHVRAGGRPPLPPDAAPGTRALAAACWRTAPAERPSAAELVAWLAAHPRALPPALQALGSAPAVPADHLPATGDDQNLYFEEWTTPEAT